MEHLLKTCSVSPLDPFNCGYNSSLFELKEKINIYWFDNNKHNNGEKLFSPDGLWRSKIHIKWYLKHILLRVECFWCYNDSNAEQYIDRFEAFIPANCMYNGSYLDWTDEN